MQKLLVDTFGFDQFRLGQEQTIIQLLGGFSSLAIFPIWAMVGLDDVVTFCK